MEPARILQLTARITGTLMVAFLLMVLFGAITGDRGSIGTPLFANMRQALTFLLFPVLTIIGLALAWKYEILGGLITLGSVLAVVLVQPDWQQPFALVPALPGLLYALHGLMGGPEAAVHATRHSH
ncbi:MAG: hypothetical protein KBH07_13165 [Flavobacteriales bacterium]|nr:hypothetical protein [Flavobacteriales bacterium]MBP9081113.1 hypothetical protein [Flavobacteriales bacterium]